MSGTDGILKKFKRATLKTLRSSGVFSLVENSRWRQRRLLILAYHGISLADEHLWDYTQFMSPSLFRARLQLIKKSGATVLPLGQALDRLYANDLPDKSVVITFDDGTADFQAQAFPILREFDFPVTLYLTTYYTSYNRPVFDVMCSYLLWKGRGATLDLMRITGKDLKINLSSGTSREASFKEIQRHANEQKLSAEGKDMLATELAKALNVNYDAILEKRILQLLTSSDVKYVALNGVDVQLHTHRHRVPRNHELFLGEIEDNRRCIRELTGAQAEHFCYPSGVYDPMFLPWLEEAGIRSATTSDLGLASPRSNRLLLPRLLDVSSLSENEFTGWLSGIGAALPRRRIPKNTIDYAGG
jgi:peptidoglycan/xylan/chitin deacetylase (PgdA/CDA1 family)